MLSLEELEIESFLRQESKSEKILQEDQRASELFYFLHLSNVVCFLFTLYTCSASFLTQRHLVPFFPPWFYPFPIMSYFWISCLVFSLLFSLVPSKSQQKALYAVVIFILILMLEDQSRWQPYHYHFFLIFFILANFSSRNLNQIETVALQILFASTYFHSGLSKYGCHFVSNIVPWMFGGCLKLTDLGFEIFGYGACTFEMMAGVFLCFSRTSRYTAIALCFHHAGILFLLSTTVCKKPGLWNPQVYPWNLSCILSLLAIFVFQKPTSVSSFLGSYGHQQSTLILGSIFLFFLCPFLNYIGAWDDYASFHLYSGCALKARVCDQRLRVYFPAETFINDCLQLGYEIRELSSTLPPQLRIYRRVHVHLTQLTNAPLELSYFGEKEWVKDS